MTKRLRIISSLSMSVAATRTRRPLQSRKTEYVEIYNPSPRNRSRISRTAAWSAATPIASGSARCTISFPTG